PAIQNHGVYGARARRAAAPREWVCVMRVDESRLTATYMMASRKHGTLYLGSALDFIVRVSEHKEGIGSAFVRKYGVTRLVWYQPFMLVSEAREREYEMKKWRRD